MKLFLRICTVLLAAPAAWAASGPKTWWPDVTANLMWTGEDNGSSVNFAGAQSFCQGLTLNGYTGWRVPTVGELEGIAHFAGLDPGVYLTDRGYPGLNLWLGTAWRDTALGWIWSSSPAGEGKLNTVMFGVLSYNHRRISKPTDHLLHYTFCVRPLESEIAAIAKDFKIGGSVKDTNELQGWVWLDRAETAYAAGNFEEALSYGRKAVAALPPNARATGLVGRSELYLGQWSEAAAALQHAAGLDPDHYSGDAGAAQFAKNAAAKDPNVGPAYVLLGKANTAMTASRFEEAAEDAKQLTQIEPKWSQGYTLWAQSEQYLGKFSDEEAVWDRGYRATKDGALKNGKNMARDFEKQAAKDPNLAPETAAVSEAKRANYAGEYAKAQAAAKQAMALEPNMAPGFNEFGWACGKLGQWDLAVTALQQAVKLDDGAAPAYQNNLHWAQIGQKATAAPAP